MVLQYGTGNQILLTVAEWNSMNETSLFPPTKTANKNRSNYQSFPKALLYGPYGQLLLVMTDESYVMTLSLNVEKRKYVL